MNTIPLRAYNREIEEALEQKHTEEAISHCRHILKVFPKHINTYRLLGKAYLESQRYGNASDIFQRVLSSVPDDFVSHVGMSIIREDEGNLDAAIWHMERAFESQPYNTAIQGELRRLYGQRDGMEPPKIRMTRGALARMYGKSDLYDQAISEIRSNLVEDPQRADLEVLLAQMYVKNGQQTEAIQVCSSLLKRLPYCIEPNRYLSQIFSGGERSDELKTYRQRLEALDPYEAHTSANMPNAEDVPDQAVTVNRLDWDGGAMISQESEQPEWATSIGVQFDELDSEDQDLPDWLRDSSESSPGHEETTQDESEDIPEWMQEAGWGPSKGEFDESKPVFDFDETPESRDEAIAGDIPSWLQDIAPQDALSEDLDLTAGSSDLPSWLMEEADGASDTIVNWLDDKEKDDGIGIPKDEDEEIAGTTEVSDDSTDWAQEFGGSKKEALTEELPDWLTSLDDSEADTDATQVVSSLGPETSPEDELSEIPDWLIGMTDEPSIPTRDYTDKSLSEEDEAEVPEWLQGIGESAAGITPAIPNLDSDQTESSDIPDWLQEMGDDLAREDEAVEETGDEEPAETPDWLKDFEGVTEELEAPQPITLAETTDEDTGGIPDWLQGTGDDMAGEDESVQEPGEVEPAETPDWLNDLEGITEESEAPQPIALAETTDEDSGDVPDWLQGMGDDMAGEDQAIEETSEAELAEIPDWLKDFEGVTDEPEAPQPIALAETTDEDSGDVPDWLQQEGELAPQGVDHTDEMVEFGADEIPDWLKEMGDTSDKEEAKPQIEPMPEDSIEVPEWLQPIGDEILTEIEPTGESGEIEPTEIADKPMDLEVEQSESHAKEVFEEELGTLLGPIDEDDVDVTPSVSLEDLAGDEPVDIPDWLKEMEGEQAVPTQTQEAPKPTLKTPALFQDETVDDAILETEAGVTPDWLDGLEDQEMGDVSMEESPPETHDQEPSVDVPDWLEDITKGEPVSSVPSGVTGWLRNIDEEKLDEMVIDYEPGELPEWLESMVRERSEGAEEPVETLQADIDGDAEAQPTKDDDVESSLETPDLTPTEVETVQEAIEDESTTPETVDISAEEPGMDFDFEDADAAMAWLEGLAAKQGVSEEELLTKPEDRLETPPQWVQEEIEVSEEAGATEPEDVTPKAQEEEPEPVELTAETLDFGETEDVETHVVEQEPIAELPDWLGDLEESEEIPTEAPEMVAEADSEEELPEFDLDDADAAMAWLEGLAAKQGVSEEELLTSPEERSEEPPEWVREEMAGETEADVPDWLRATLEDETTLEETLSETPPEEIEQEELPDWLKAAYDSDSIVQETMDEPEEAVLEETEILTEDLDEIPEFLGEAYQGEAKEVEGEVEARAAELADETALEFPVEETPTDEVLVEPEDVVVEETTEAQAPEAPSDSEDEETQPEFEIEPPDWVLSGEEPEEKEYVWVPGEAVTEEREAEIQLDLNEASMIQLERLSPLGFRKAQAIIAHRNENGPFEDLSELLSVPGINQVTLEQLKPLLFLKPVAAKEIPAPEPPTIPEDAFHALHLEAQSDIMNGNIDAALAKYIQLIQQGQRLDQILEDLSQAIASGLYTSEMVDILTDLGDAFLSLDRLQPALNAYTKAEEILR